ncbi:MAG: hypothetical protein JWR21_1249 [Herminiimonas sp.]|nr:hypothetical protein [Herminiimonas sp.]
MSKFAGLGRTIIILTFAAVCGSATAVPITFTWQPSGATPPLNGGAIVNANNFNVADFSSLAINTNGGAFTQIGALNIVSFQNNGSPVASTGLDSTYSIYFIFSATGTLPGIPIANGTSTTGTLTGFDYELVGSTSGVPPLTFPVTNGAVAVTDPGAHTVLGYGALVPGTGFFGLTRTANGYSPSENVNLTFNACLSGGQGGGCTANQSAFFAAPAAGLNRLVGNFSAADAQTTVSTSGNISFVNIVGGAAQHVR